jgi:WD40 repeat protein
MYTRLCHLISFFILNIHILGSQESQLYQALDPLTTTIIEIKKLILSYRGNNQFMLISPLLITSPDACAYSANGKYLIYATPRAVNFLNLETFEEVKTLEVPHTTALAHSPCGTYVATQTKLLKPATDPITRTLSIKLQDILSIHDINNNCFIEKKVCGTALSYSPDGRLLIRITENKSCELLEAGTNAVSRRFNATSDFFTAYACSFDNIYLALAGKFWLYIWNRKSNQWLSPPLRPSNITTLAYDAQSNYLAAASGKTLFLFQTPHHRCIQQLKTDHTICAIAFFAKNNLLVIALDNKSLEIWDIVLLKRIEEISNLRSRIIKIISLPYKSQFITVGQDNMLDIWDKSDKEPKQEHIPTQYNSPSENCVIL